MDVAKLVGVVVVCAISCLLLRESRPELALVIALCGGIVILFAAVQYMARIVSAMSHLVDMTGLDTEVFSCVLKMIGIGYIAEFGAGVCEDSGNRGLGDKLILTAKIVIVGLSLPVVGSLLKLLSQLL